MAPSRHDWKIVDWDVKPQHKQNNFKTLASFWSWADRFESYLVENPKDRFSCDEAQLISVSCIRRLTNLLLPKIWRHTEHVFKHFYVNRNLKKNIAFEPQYDKTNKMTCAPSEDLDQPRHLPSLTRVFAGAHWVAKDSRFLHADSKDWSDCAVAQADPSLLWAHRSFYWFCHVAAHMHFKLNFSYLIKWKFGPYASIHFDQ